MSEHPRRVYKDDLPPELWPQWDRLEHVAQQMERSHRALHRARWGCLVACGFCIGTGVANIAVMLQGL